MSQTVNVKDFGAIGNGIADDSNAFQNAISSISPYGSIFVPEGTYRITKTIIFPSISGYSGITMFGCGFGTVIKASSSVNILFDILGENVSIKDIFFDGSETLNATTIRIGGSNGIIDNGFTEINHCKFTVWSNAIRSTTDSWVISSCYFIDVNKAIYALNNCLNSSIHSCYFLGGETSVHLSRLTQQPEGVRIYDNTMLNNKINAKSILIDCGLEIYIFNNIIDQIGENGWSIYMIPSLNSSISNIKITNNWLDSGKYGGSLFSENMTALWINSNTLNSASGEAIGIRLKNVNTYWIKDNYWLSNFTKPSVLKKNSNGNISGNCYRPSQDTIPIEKNQLKNSFDSSGLILSSPNGTRYSVFVNDNGIVTSRKL